MSNLISRLKEVDLGGCRLSDEDGEYLECHVVSDIPTDFSAVKIIFLMESPHKIEVEKKCPLAGPSGVAVTEDLITNCALKRELHDEYRKAPIGSLVEGREIRSLSILNVSSLPLQKEAYGGECENSNEMQVLWRAFKEIKAEFEKKMDDGDPDLCPLASRVYEVIENDLICRIEGIVGLCQSPPSIIAFGNVARRSICRAKRRAKGTPIADISVCGLFPPHPSSRSKMWKSWKSGKLNEGYNMSDLVKYIDGRLYPIVAGFSRSKLRERRDSGTWRSPPRGRS